MDSDLLIVGGGPAGLAAAFWKQRQSPGLRIRVLEASDHPGGWLRSEHREGYLCEHGPQSIRPTEEFTKLVAALGIEDQIVDASALAATRWLGRGGKLLQVPSSPVGLLKSPLLTWRGKWRLSRETRVSRHPANNPSESMAAFCARRFGPESVPLVQAMVGGIFAGDAERLEVLSAFPTLAQLELESGSVFGGLRHRRKQLKLTQKESGQTKGASPSSAMVTFRDGMQGFVAGLANAVGDSLECGVSVASLQFTDGAWTVTMSDGRVHRAAELVLACPANVSARLLAPVAPELASELAEIPFVSLASVYLGMPMPLPPKKMTGFGCLLTYEPNQPVLGAIYASQVFPNQAPAGHQLVRVMIGGSLHADVTQMLDQELVDMAVAMLRRHVEPSIAATFTHVVRCRSAIPQYELGHSQRLERISKLLSGFPGLSLRGNSYRGVAVTAQLGADVGLSGKAIDGSN
jgi:oxygen-dependent protoporphyrinogen oxidase